MKRSKNGKVLPPEGCMWDPWHNNQLTTIALIEGQSRTRMAVWDDAVIERGIGHKFYWKQDPSYHWAVKRKRKRGAK